SRAHGILFLGMPFFLLFSKKLGVFCLGLLEDWSVGIGIFPEDKELLICGPCFGVISGQGERPAKFQACQGADGLSADDAGVIKNFLKFSGSRSALAGCQIRLAPEVNRIKNEIQALNIAPKLMGRCRCEDSYSFAIVVAMKVCRGMDHR